MAKILYLDMDNALVDFRSAFTHFSPELLCEYEGRQDELPGIFSKMAPMPGAIEAFTSLAQSFGSYLLSTAPWNNPSAWSDKLEWVKSYFGPNAYKRPILTHQKHLNVGNYLVDNRPNNGADRFSGE